MTDAPAPVPDAPTGGLKVAGRHLPVETWQVAAALGLGIGVVVGIRVAHLLRPAKLPAHQPCPNCEQRRVKKAVEMEAAAHAQALAHNLLSSRSEHPPMATVRHAPPITADPTREEEGAGRSFSAQAIPEPTGEPEPPVEVAVGDGALDYDHENLPDDAD